MYRLWKILIWVFAALIFLLTAYYLLQYSRTERVADSDYPSVTLQLNRGKVEVFPESNKNGVYDLRGCDLTGLSLKKGYKEQLDISTYDNKTLWPYALPEGFNPKQKMEKGKNPGLDIKSLHENGIDGSGVGIAVIGPPLLVQHVEYKDQISLYNTSLNDGKAQASYDACAAVSCMVGGKTGVAPKAFVYYFADNNLNDDGLEDEKGEKKNYITGYLTKCLSNINDMSDSLDVPIEVVYIGIDLRLVMDDREFNVIISDTKQAGIFIVSDYLYEAYDGCFDVSGLSRDLDALNSTESNGPSKEWSSGFFTFGRIGRGKESLLLPLDNMTLAASSGIKDYVYYPVGFEAKPLAYLTGLYALACQVRPDITPDMFWHAAVSTGKEIEIINPNIDHVYRMGRIVNPPDLMEALK